MESEISAVVASALASRGSGLTLVTVGASEALLALAGELAPRLAPAAAVRSTHV